KENIDELSDEDIFPTKTDRDNKIKEIPYYDKNGKWTKYIRPSLSKPRVFIPVFPGTNCEIDSKRAFEKAGAEVLLQNILNLNPQLLEESILISEKKIREANIIMLPGGFSLGDEPCGSAKYITQYFKNERLKFAIDDFLVARQGIILGICNGFQALIKLGLLPYGNIKSLSEDSPGLTFNSIGRHISTIVKVKKTSNLSPWLSEINKDEIYNQPISHGEGRFFCDKKIFDDLVKNGQIASQYIDGSGAAFNNDFINPNGSFMNVEGITSPDGRIFGKMGHSERIGKNLYKNVPGNYDMKIFEAGVKYYK
ncbi:MAG: phosphoribosylformylglycinamidine synthase subunit PurQ, partial [Clostridiales Family XIII bacterium]|nr:phosphoribosylformylglycinamidine synthase subunit PurQ [Clostridiales Family XIII bacterium]